MAAGLHLQGTDVFLHACTQTCVPVVPLDLRGDHQNADGHRLPLGFWPEHLHKKGEENNQEYTDTQTERRYTERETNVSGACVQCHDGPLLFSFRSLSDPPSLSTHTRAPQSVEDACVPSILAYRRGVL